MSFEAGRSLSIPSMAEELARRVPARHSTCFAFDGFRLELRSNSEALVGTIAKYLELFACEPGPCDATVLAYETDVPEIPFEFFDWKRQPGKSGKKEQVADLEGGWIVRKVRTGMHFLLGPGQRVAVGPCLANFNQIVNFVNAVFISHRLEAGWTLCHAAGVAEGGRGVGLAGTSGAGKSTLALHAMNEGLSFVSNDRLLIKKNGTVRMSGVPKHPRINPGTALHNPTLAGIVPVARRTALEAMPTAQLWSLEEKYDADIGSLYDGRWAIAADLAGFIILDWRHDHEGPAEIEQIDFSARQDLWDALFKTPGPLHVGPEGQRSENTIHVPSQPYLDTLADIPVFEIRGRVDFPKATQHCLSLIRK